MQKCENCKWHNEEGVCTNPDAILEGCVMDDWSWCCRYKRRKKLEVQDGK